MGKRDTGWSTRVPLGALLVVVLAGSAMAAPGDLDSTFSGDGKRTTNVSGSLDFSSAVAIQDDGKIVVAGQAAGANPSNFGVVRYNRGGALDTTFAGDGKQITDFMGSHETANAVAIQADGKIVVAGSVSTPGDTGQDFAVARYRPGGALDTTFHGDGKRTTDFFGDQDDGLAVAIQEDGKIVVVGVALGETNSDFAVVRYNPNGTMDTTFSGNGKQSTDIDSGSNDGGYGVAIQDDGKIVVAGHAGGGSAADFAVVRYRPRGALDTTFDGIGFVTTDFSGDDDDGSGVALQEDGKIVVGGSTFDGTDYDFAVARYTTVGALDTSFSGDGKQSTDIDSGSSDLGEAVALQEDGKIVVAGSAGFASSSDFGLVRYRRGGALDTTFGGGTGLVTTDFFVGADSGRAVAIQADGKIVVAGGAETGAGNDFAVARYLAEE